MAEFDDKLNSLLSNPEAMDQIMKMAQSLMGNSGEGPETGGSARNAAGVSGSAAPPPALLPLAAQPSGGFGFPPQAGASGAGTPQSPGRAGWSPPSGVQSGSDLSFLSGLGNLDPKTIASLLPVLRELGGAQDSNARQLLFALRPYLKPERQEKVERALQLARLFRVGKKFLLKGDGHV